MILRGFAACLAIVVATALVSAPALAQTNPPPAKKRVVTSRSLDHTVVRSRDEDGRTRTKIVVQPRSFLNPGTQVFPGERRYNDGVDLVRSEPFSTLNNTPFSHREPLPGRFDLPFRSAPDF